MPTFIESRATSTCISDGRDLSHWSVIDGMVAMLHERPRQGTQAASFQVQFAPSEQFREWHGRSDIDLLKEELQNCDLFSALLFNVCLSWALESPTLRVHTSPDALINAIGQDENARQGDREALRLKVHRSLLVFDSLYVIGARPGTWREPGPTGSREKMDVQELHSSDVLLKILGKRFTSPHEVPKEYVLTVGPWAEKFQGNREILSDFGNLRLIAGIPARRVAGTWAQSIGLNLSQHWREKSATATPLTPKNGGETSLRFSPVTRRDLLLAALRPNHNIQDVLDSKNPQRAKEYWEAAVVLLKEAGVIGHYEELQTLPEIGWKEAWLDQPLDIRPQGQMMADACTIRGKAAAARKRKQPKSGAKN